MTIRAALFDLDDTLVPERAGWDAAFHGACSDFCHEHGVEVFALRRAVFDEAQELWRASPVGEWCRQLGLGSPSSLLSDFPGEGIELAYLRDWAPLYRHLCWRAGFEQLGLADTPQIDDLSEAFRDAFRAGYAAYPEAMPALEALTGLKLGVVSNGNSDLQRAKLRVSGLERYFGPVVISAEVGIGKPDSGIFRLALDALGIAADEAVMVGDSPERDMIGAHDAGLHCIWLDREHSDRAPSTPHLRIESLTELSDAVKAL